MTKRRRRNCLNCRRLFRPDPRNVRHQRYCSAPAVRKASQTRWLSKPQSRNYFRGAEKDYNFKPVVLMQFHAVGSTRLIARMEFLRPTAVAAYTFRCPICVSPQYAKSLYNASSSPNDIGTFSPSQACSR